MSMTEEGTSPSTKPAVSDNQEQNPSGENGAGQPGTGLSGLAGFGQMQGYAPVSGEPQAASSATEAEPDIPAPFIVVTLPLPGISPEDGERLLVRPTELELQSIEGLIQMDSLAFDGAAQIILEFKTTIDVARPFLMSA